MHHRWFLNALQSKGSELEGWIPKWRPRIQSCLVAQLPDIFKDGGNSDSNPRLSFGGIERKREIRVHKRQGSFSSCAGAAMVRQ